MSDPIVRIPEDDDVMYIHESTLAELLGGTGSRDVILQIPIIRTDEELRAFINRADDEKKEGDA